MRRSIDDAIGALRRQVTAWADRRDGPGVRILVYPPEWEAQMIVRIAHCTEEWNTQGYPVTTVDLGQGFLAELQGRQRQIDALEKLEWERPGQLQHDLSVLASRYVQRMVTTPPEPPNICRLLTNAGSPATLVSYSAIFNGISIDSGDGDVPIRAIVAFPGEDDERSLSLLRLRADMNYRVARI